MKKHIPVLLREVISFSTIDSGAKYALDCTLGLGGHAGELLKSIPTLKLCAIDADDKTRVEVDKQLSSTYPGRFNSANLNFSELEDLVQVFDIEDVPSKFDLILADLGISSVQLDDPDRGLSHRFDGPLDMRLDHRLKVTAADVVNNRSENELLFLLKKGGLGPERKFLAKEIIKNRPIETTSQFKSICETVYLRDRQRKGNYSTGSVSVSLPFQALRMEVNKELEVLTQLLVHSIRLLSDGGRLMVISFHSGEDTLVTRAMRWWSSQRGQGLHPEDAPLGKLLTPKALVPTEEEILLNPRSRSARMRVFQRNSNVLWTERAILPTNYPLQ